MSKNPDPPQPDPRVFRRVENTGERAHVKPEHVLTGQPPQSQAGQQPESLADILIGAAGLLDLIKGEWGDAWSEWDQSIRDGITKHLEAIYGAEAAQPQPEPQFIQGRQVPLADPALWWWQCRLCGTSTTGEKPPTDHRCSLIPANWRRLRVQQETPVQSATSAARESQIAESESGTKPQSPTPKRSKDSRNSLGGERVEGDGK